MLKKHVSLILSLALILTLITGCSLQKKDNKDNKDQTTTAQTETSETFTKEDAATYNIAMLKGPTAIGFIKAWDDSDNGLTLNKYNVTAYGTADEITTGLIKGDIDIAAVPCNLASVLYNKTNGAISVAGINTLGVLYVVSTSDNIKSVSDLKGKTIYSTGQGTTPEYTMNYILKENGLTPGTDVKIEYKSEAAEVAAVLSQSDDAIALLPQPYVTTVLQKNQNAKIVLDLTKEWDKISDNNALVTGVVVVRNEVIEKNKKAFKAFLEDYKSSTDYVNKNVEDAAALVEKHDIFKAAIAKAAIPNCNITFIDGNEMKTNISSYLNVLKDANAQSIGGKLPDDNFYYTAK